MSVRSEREKSKMQDKYQVILAQMLKEDDNRFCVDCDTKSPRWASWNLGIFICIRCAGFHRNLGVHISKVKSVNLDSWTADQIASMQAMGNNKARAVYEANLPPGFRRPQADAALEAFIRAKYEQRKWIAKEWIPPEIKVSSDLIESETNTRRVDITSEPGHVEKPTSTNIPKIKPIATPTPTTNPVRQQVTSDRATTTTQVSITPSPSTTSISNPAPPAVIENPPDLLGLDEPALPVTKTTPSFPSTSTKGSSSEVNPLHELFSSPPTTTNENKSALTNFDQDLQSAFSSPNETTSSSNSTNLLTTDKIMALYNTPQTSSATSSGMNIRPASMQPTTGSPAFAHPSMPPPHLLSHQKSASFGSNLYQQTTNHFPSQPSFATQQAHPLPIRPGMPAAFYQNPNNLSSPTLQNPSSAFTHEQLNNQFSQFVPFANSKTNTSASALISGMPTRPVTDHMPASSDLLWQ